MPQETCKDSLSLLDLPKLVRLGIGHEKCRQDIERLVHPHIHPSHASQSVEITMDPSPGYSRIIFRTGITDQHPVKFGFHYYHIHGDHFSAKNNFVSALPRMGRKPYYADDSEGDAGSFPERGHAVIPGTGFVNVL